MIQLKDGIWMPETIDDCMELDCQCCIYDMKGCPKLENRQWEGE